MDIVKISFLVVSITTASASVVNTTIGQVQGKEIPTMGIEHFLGIPYAEAPEGVLRFKPPVRKARMEGVYNATSNARVCPQATVGLLESTLNRSITATEDCLRLDIYKPITAKMGDALPVMIYIHGGGYFAGASCFRDGSQLAGQHDVIVVAANYRLGILGFLNTMDETSIGNFGLRDQCSAIEWVYDNIEGFGGNASHITMFGHSAGSSSVIQLPLSSLCKGKFQRVIAQSGSPYAYWSYMSDPLESARRLANYSNCPLESGPLVTCLRQKTIEDIISYQPFSLSGIVDWGPSYSGDVFPENPLEIAANDDNSDAHKHFRSIDILLGVTSEEGEVGFVARKAGSVFGRIANLSDAILSEDELNTELLSRLKLYTERKNEDLKKLLPAVKFQYTDWFNKDDSLANTQAFIRINGDVAFHIGVVKTARLHTTKSSTPGTGNTYFYQFNRKPSSSYTYPWNKGATHGDDPNFVFGVSSSEEDRALSREMMEYWTNFAKTGDPNSPSNNFIKVQWPTFNTETEEYLKINVNMSLDSVSKYPYARRVAFWEDFVPSQMKLVDDYNKEKEKTEHERCKDKRKIGSDGSRMFPGLHLCMNVVLVHFLRYF